MGVNLRNYENSAHQTKVENTYKQVIENQTLDYVIKIKQKYSIFPKITKPIWYVINRLNTIIDESDPDNDLPQSVHACQTAASIISQYITLGTYNLKSNISIKDLFTDNEWRYLPITARQLYNNKYLHELYPDIKIWDWFPLVGFIHDLGKILLTKEFGELPQWSVVGDTFPVGCEFGHRNVFYNKKYHHNNKDFGKYGNFGIYKYLCGFDKLHMSYGHDEYLANVLEKNNTKLPKEAIYIIRYHSFYSWHTPKNNLIRGYTYFANKEDWRMLPLLKAFQKSDLYSKISKVPNMEQIYEIFNPLIEKYGLAELTW